MAEKDIQKAILDYLLLKKIYCWKQHNTGIYYQKEDKYIHAGMKGVSDILGVLPDGKFLAIEVKTKYNKPTKHQEDFLENIKLNNGVAFVARSIDDVQENLGDYL